MTGSLKKKKKIKKKERKKKEGGCSVIRACSLIRSNTVYFLAANCFIFYVLCHDVLLPLTMSIVYLFVSVYCFIKA